MPRQRDLSKTGRREQILDEALRLFAERGIHHVTTRDIAGAVGVSQPSLYAHFANRDAIAVEVCCRAFADLHRSLEDAARSDGDAPARLRQIARTYVAFGLENAAAYQVAFMLALPAEENPLKSRVLQAGLRAFGVLRALFDEHGLAIADPDLAAQSVWASLHGLVSLMLVREEFPWADREALVENHIDRVCAIAPPRRPGSSG